MSKLKQYKISRRLGAPIFDKCQTAKYALALSRKEKNRKIGKYARTKSEYGQQLMEKQKVRYLYGISESQMKKYIKESERIATGEERQSALLDLLERRIDNVVYRSGFAETRRHARQLVSHGHFLLNGKKVRVPSILTKVGDEIVVRDGSKAAKAFASINKNILEKTIPKWIKSAPKTLKISVADKSFVDKSELIFDISRVFEYYSK